VEVRETELCTIIKGGKESGMFLRGKRRKRTTGIHVKEVTRDSRTVTVMGIRLLRTLTNKARDAV
jgi:hypothetical protein